jgi:hypothetical protein
VKNIAAIRFLPTAQPIRRPGFQNNSSDWQKFLFFGSTDSISLFINHIVDRGDFQGHSRSHRKIPACRHTYGLEDILKRGARWDFRPPGCQWPYTKSQPPTCLAALGHETFEHIAHH